MDSAKLSARETAPGSDRSFEESERNFIAAAGRCLDAARYELVPKPKDLKRIFKHVIDGKANLGFEPEAVIVSRENGRLFFVEVKKQDRGGNAEERAYKHHTVQFYKTLAALYPHLGYHPYVTVFCDELATYPRYTSKFPYLIERDHYFLWVGYDEAALCGYLNGRCRAWLDD